MTRQPPREKNGEFAAKSETQKTLDAISARAADGKPACLECGKAMDERHDPDCNTGRRLAIANQHS